MSEFQKWLEEWQTEWFRKFFGVNRRSAIEMMESRMDEGY